MGDIIKFKPPKIDKVSDNSEEAQVFNFQESLERIKLYRVRKLVEEIMAEVMPDKEEFENFGVGTTREEVINRIAEIMAEDENSGEVVSYISQLKAQISIDTSISNLIKTEIYSKLGILVNRVRARLRNGEI